MAAQGGIMIQKNWIAAILGIFILGSLLGFSTSNNTGIQPGYFEKQEAPAYGVAEAKSLGSDFGSEFEEHFKNLYKDE
jgi:hypothetical protein